MSAADRYLELIELAESTVNAPDKWDVPHDVAFDLAGGVLELDAYAARLMDCLAKTVAVYGKPGGPWNVPSEPGTWIAEAQALLGLKPFSWRHENGGCQCVECNKGAKHLSSCAVHNEPAT